MRVHATLNNLRIAPRKVRLVAHSIVGLTTAQARLVLRDQVKRASSPVETLLKSAIANATNNFSLAEETLTIKEVRVGDGARLKRYMPKAFGQATPILRRSSTVHIVLEGEVGAKPARKQSAPTPEKQREEQTKAEAPATKVDHSTEKTA